jgi:hypothetical protein
MESRLIEKPSTTLPAVVERIIKPEPHSGEPEKAQLAVKGADHYYRELRIENELRDKGGRKVGLKPGAEVELTVQADPEDTTPKA